MAIKLTSPSFGNGGTIPAAHTCDGPGYSPGVYWENIPRGTKSLALIVDDPDAPMGTWDHWVVFNLSPELSGLMENIESAQGFPDGTIHGLNSWNRIGWGGPCPPDKEHRYFFRVYALDARLDLPDKARKQDVLRSMEGHILDQGELMGRYTKRR